MVHLQRQLGAGVDHNALDLKPLPLIHRIERTPGAKHLAVLIHLGSPLGFQGIDDFFHVLCMIFVRNQHRVFGFDHHQILYATQRHQALLGVDIGIAAGLEHHIAPTAVALGIVGQDFSHGRPSTHIAPARIEGHHRSTLGFFHHGVVDTDGRRSGKRLRCQANEFEVASRPGPSGLTRLKQLRLMHLQFTQEHRGLEHEHATVPGVVARLQKRRGRFEVGLFTKARHRHCRLSAQALGGLNVAIAGFGVRGHDAKGDQLTLQSSLNGHLHRLRKRWVVGNEVIRRQDQQHRIGLRILGLGERLSSQGRHRNGRGRVARHGFEQQPRRLHPHAAALLAHQKAVIFIGDHHR